MQQLLLFFVCIILVAGATGQKNYDEAMRQGDDSFNKQQYKTAINKYFAAEAFDPSKKDVVRAKVNKVFDRIEALRAEANKAKKEAQESLKKSDKLIGTFYFYNGRFALAYKSPGVDRAGIQRFIFYYINQNGDNVNEFGEWDTAGPFKQTGFAKVKGRYDPQDYLIDTFGHRYSAAFDIKNMDSSIVALDLSENEEDEDSLFYKITKFEQLKVLVLNGSKYKVNYIFSIPGSIGRLKKLEHLQMAFCGIDTISPQIRELTNLSILNLSGNKLKTLPPGISELKNLSVLDLSSNVLESLPASIGGLNHLIQLSLRYNPLTNLPREIEELTHLQILDLKGTRIPEAEIERLKKLFKNCQVLF